MARHKDTNWSIPHAAENWTQVGVAVLMDLRDELKKLNALLHCSNFTAIPYKLDKLDARLRKIEKNTTKRKYVRKVVA